MGTEHIFQEPSFSGSTSANVLAGSSSLVANDAAFGGTQSDKIIYEFTDTNPSRWIRLTTFVAGGTPSGQPYNVAQAYARAADALRGRGSFDIDFDLAVQRHKLIDAIERSSATGRSVKVD